MLTRGLLLRAGALLCLGLAAMAPAGATAAEQITYLLPASPALPAFGPWQVAKARGYYEHEGLDVTFQGARGGVDVAKQIGKGEVLVGGGVGDTTMIVRPAGYAVKAVAIIGGKSLMQLVVHANKGVEGPRDLRGRIVSTMAYHDTAFYTLLGMLAKVGVSRSDLQIEAAGRDGVWKLFTAGSSVGMASIPDWIALAEGEGVKLMVIPADDYFKGMAQAVLVSDETIRRRPELVQKLVRATLKGMADIMEDPGGCAKDFVKAVPDYAEKLAYITRVFELYNKYVYPGQKVLGEIDPARLAAVQEFYNDSGIIRTRVPVEDLYTNRFVRAGP
jgi:NitT/TauT family transport system substrate-binding protein